MPDNPLMRPRRPVLILLAASIVTHAISACTPEPDAVPPGDPERWCAIERERRILGTTFSLDSPPEVIEAAVDEAQELWDEAWDVVPANIRADFGMWVERERGIWQVIADAGYDADAVDIVRMSRWVGGDEYEAVDIAIREFVAETCVRE